MRTCVCIWISVFVNICFLFLTSMSMYLRAYMRGGPCPQSVGQEQEDKPLWFYHLHMGDARTTDCRMHRVANTYTFTNILTQKQPQIYMKGHRNIFSRCKIHIFMCTYTFVNLETHTYIPTDIRIYRHAYIFWTTYLHTRKYAYVHAEKIIRNTELHLDKYTV